MSKPEPLTPEYCDLRGYEFMPLFGHKLFASEFYTEASADEFRAGLRLWWAAWNQVPAGSLPNSDRALATLADFGRDIEAWQDVKERALHGFIECSDGRLYHPMICAEAIDSYEERLRKSKRRTDDKERLKQWREMRRNQERNASHADDTDNSETEVKRVSGAYQTEERNAPVQRAARRDRDRDRDSNTHSLRSCAAASPGAEPQAVAVIPPDSPLDARTALFRTGVTTVQAMTGIPGPKVRTLLGKWLKDCGDDCAMLNDIIAHAADTRPAEPQAFIAGAIRHRTAGDFRQLETNWGLDDVDLDAALRDQERALGL
ncbi:DUF1376 domain-containing protein [Asaia bogorensis]|uniref:DUF1376 domain-containing protein n=1 Tax=Asaia bogorensis TaxID=91915 RepID=UPI000EFDAE6C|nr:DUF1376 domain-containing protein [Asaia bogorensis]